MNLVDLLFAVFIGFYAYRGFHRGLVREGFDLLGFGLGLALAIRAYPLAAAPFRLFGIDEDASKILGGTVIFVAFIVAAALISNRAELRIGKVSDSDPMKVGGAAFASAWSTMFAIFMMIVLTVIPAPRVAQAAVRDSFIGSTVLSGDSRLYPWFEDYASNEARNLLFYLRQYFSQLDPPKPQKDSGAEYFEIEPSDQIEIDVAAEQEILQLVNKERVSRGLNALRSHVPIRAVARRHSADMYQRGYFAHENPDGQDPFERMAEGRVSYSYAGENLALAPTIAMVHQGLMDSPKHKANILKQEFTDLGIGVYIGPYGLMVTQNFCAGCR